MNQKHIDTAFLYEVLSKKAKDALSREIYASLAKIERKLAKQDLKPSLRVHLLKLLGQLFGFHYVESLLLEEEKSYSLAVLSLRKKLRQKRKVSDTAHAIILNNLWNKDFFKHNYLVSFEKKYRPGAANALRAAVLGANDGLLSIFILVAGVAGATMGQKEILLSGFAGLLAGALSMAMGEWISVKSSRELYEHSLVLHEEEISENKNVEKEELFLILKTQGLEKELENLIKDEKKKEEFLQLEESNLRNEEIQDSPLEAALASFILFMVSGFIPLIPFFFITKWTLFWSSFWSLLGLFILGALITLFTNKSPIYSGFRQLVFGLIAGLGTFFIGKIFGVTLN